MYRITNYLIMKCKLNQRNETSLGQFQEDWDRLIGICLPQDFQLSGYQEEYYDLERDMGEAEAIAQSKLHRCSVYYAEGLPDLMLREAQKKGPSPQTSEIDQRTEAPWWHEPLRTLVTLSQRLFVYQRLLAVRVPRPQLAEHLLAETVLGKASRQPNLSRLREAGTLPEEWQPQRELTAALAGSGPTARILEDLEFVLSTHPVPQDPDTALLLTTQVFLEQLQKHDLSHAGSPLITSFRHLQQAAGDPVLLAGTAADYRRWLRKIPAPVALEDSCLVDWLHKLPKLFPKIEREPQDVLQEIVYRGILHKIDDTEQMQELFPESVTKPSLEFDVAVDRLWIRTQMLKHFLRGDPRRELVFGLVTGRSWEIMREKFQKVAPPPRDWSSDWVERIGQRVWEWHEWLTGRADPYRCDGTIEYEIPPAAKSRRALLAQFEVADWFDLYCDKDWNDLDADIQEVLRWGLFSVLLDEVFVVFKQYYKQNRADVQALKSGGSKARIRD